MFQKCGSVSIFGFNTATVVTQAQIIDTAILFKHPQCPCIGLCNSGRQMGQVFLSDRDKMSDSGKLGNRFKTALRRYAGIPEQIDGNARKALSIFIGRLIFGTACSKNKSYKQHNRADYLHFRRHLFVLDDQPEYAVLLRSIQQHMTGLAAKSLKIPGRAAVGCQNGQHVALLHLRQSLFGTQNRQRAFQPDNVQSFAVHVPIPVKSLNKAELYPTCLQPSLPTHKIKPFSTWRNLCAAPSF